MVFPNISFLSLHCFFHSITDFPIFPLKSSNLLCRKFISLPLLLSQFHNFIILSFANFSLYAVSSLNSISRTVYSSFFEMHPMFTPNIHLSPYLFFLSYPISSSTPLTRTFHNWFTMITTLFFVMYSLLCPIILCFNFQ